MSRLVSFLRGNLIAVIALAVALGGFAYANERNSVGAKELKPPRVRINTTLIKPGEAKELVQRCQSGERYISGGYDATPADTEAQPLNVFAAGPLPNNNNRANLFNFAAQNNGTADAPVSIFVLCLPK